jgi:hypothetical protein
MTITDQTVGSRNAPYYEGDSLDINVNVTTPDGSAKDISGASIRFKVKDDFGEPALLSDSDSGVSTTITDATAGELTVSLDAGVTDGLADTLVYLVRIQIGSSETTVTTGGFFIRKR